MFECWSVIKHACVWPEAELWSTLQPIQWLTCTPQPCLYCNVSITAVLFRQPRNLPDKWDHDMYEDDGSGVGGGGISGRLSSKLLISNLDYGVSNADIKVGIAMVCTN